MSSDTENLNPDDLFNSIKQTTVDIQNLSRYDTQYDDFRKTPTSLANVRVKQELIGGGGGGGGGRSPSAGGAAHQQQRYNADHYQETVSDYQEAVSV